MIDKILKEVNEKFNCSQSGCCMVVTEFISEKLNSLKIDHVVVEGYVNFYNKGKKMNTGKGPQHTWIELKIGQKIDTTVIQFDQYRQLYSVNEVLATIRYTKYKTYSYTQYKNIPLKF